MDKLMHLEIPPAVHHLLQRLHHHRFKGYVVGGAVRDALLRKRFEDVDLLTDASVEDLYQIFSDQQVKRVGRSFPVCLINAVEVATQRPAQDPALNFPASDLACRDFTINAMAFDPGTGTLIDPFDGRTDLENGMIRFTLNPEHRIMEDPVRMIRACRFLALINGQFAPETAEALVEFSGLLATGASKERIRLELLKAMAVKKPSVFFSALQKTGLLASVLPSLDRCHHLDGGPHHGETVFKHCMLVGDALPSSRPLLRLAGFLHDTGKFDAATIKNSRLTFPNHETYWHQAVQDLERLRFSVKEISHVKALILSHMRPLTPESTPKAVRRLLVMLEDNHLDYRDFLRMRIADRKGNLAKPRYTLAEIRARLEKIVTEINGPRGFQMRDLNITGTDISRILKIEPGPRVGKIKKQIFQKVVEDPSFNTPEKLERLCRSLTTNASS